MQRRHISIRVSLNMIRSINCVLEVHEILGKWESANTVSRDQKLIVSAGSMMLTSQISTSVKQRPCGGTTPNILIATQPLPS